MKQWNDNPVGLLFFHDLTYPWSIANIEIVLIFPEFPTFSAKFDVQPSKFADRQLYGITLDMGRVYHGANLFKQHFVIPIFKHMGNMYIYTNMFLCV